MLEWGQRSNTVSVSETPVPVGRSNQISSPFQSADAKGLQSLKSP